MAAKKNKTTQRSETKRRRGRKPNDRVFADLDSVIQRRVNRLAENPSLSAATIFNLSGLEDQGINPRTFRKQISKTRHRLGISSGMNGPRTLKRRANRFAKSWLAHISANHPDNFVSCVIERLHQLHFGGEEREEGERR